MIFTAAAICMLTASPIVLDNGAIRVEFDPQVFSFRFVGFPGGANFLDTLFVSEKERSGSGWIDPGGLVSDVAPLDSHDAALRRGPGEVLEQRKDYLAVLGPESHENGLRIKKEVALSTIKGKARYTVSVSILGPKPATFAVRNTVRVPKGVTLRIEKSDGAIRALAGASNIFPAVVNSNQFWIIPVPPTVSTKNVALGAFVPQVIHVGPQGTWTRRIVNPPDDAKKTPNECTFLCLLDDSTHSYGAALQGASVAIEPCCPLVFEEEWTLQKRGK